VLSTHLRTPNVAAEPSIGRHPLTNWNSDIETAVSLTRSCPCTWRRDAAPCPNAKLGTEAVLLENAVSVIWLTDMSC
jgi:hypothetical protein